MKISTSIITEILKTEISFLVFYLSYLSQSMSDLNKFGLKILFKVFSIQSKKSLKN